MSGPKNRSFSEHHALVALGVAPGRNSKESMP